MVRNWAMRFEAKHHYFKNLVGKINNFKNIDLSLAKRHQALQAYLLQETSGNFSKSSLEQGPGKLKFYIYGTSNYFHKKTCTIERYNFEENEVILIVELTIM